MEISVGTYEIKPRNFSIPLPKTEKVVVSRIPSNLHTISISKKTINYFKTLELADSIYCIPSAVELLLTGDIFIFSYDGNNILPHSFSLPVAMHSIFSYIQTSFGSKDEIEISSIGLLATMNDLCETPKMSSNLPSNLEDSYVETLFSNTGQYVVNYPFQPSFEVCDLYHQVERRF